MGPNHRLSETFSAPEFGAVWFEIQNIESFSEVRERFEFVLGPDSPLEVDQYSFGTDLTLDDYSKERIRLNQFWPSWNTELLRALDGPESHYKEGFDPLSRISPENDESWCRYPLLYQSRNGECQLQVDVLHTSQNSYLEFQSTTSKRAVVTAAKSAGLKVSFWDGDIADRWRDLDCSNVVT